MVALDVETGKRVWHFSDRASRIVGLRQSCRAEPLDITVSGTRVKALAQITKQGFVYTFDRTNGKPVWPVSERPVPPSDVPGETAYSTHTGRASPRRVDGIKAQLSTTSATSRQRFRALAVKAVEGFSRDRS